MKAHIQALGFLLALTFAPSALRAESHDTAKPAKQAEGREKTVKKGVTADYVVGRWAGDSFEYKTADGWATPAGVHVATDKDPMAFQNADGVVVHYEVGDILFRIEGMGWFKAIKDSPKIEDPMVPNPTGFKLSQLERDAVRATNEWRARHKLPPLKVDPILMRTARNRPQFSHSANGMSSWDEAHRNGFQGPATDNLSSGDMSGKGSVENLGSEPGEGHWQQLMGRAKINGQWVDQRFDSMGVGTTGPGGTWTHIYGRNEARPARK